MKELSIEEKAKAYDKAIERLRNAFYDNNSRMCEEYREAVIRIIEPIFPELKESEDEKIRKWLIALIKSNEYGSISNVGEMPCSKLNILAWLEKRCETFTKKDVDDAYLKGVCDTKQELEKQGEQKKINLVEILKHYPKETELYSPLYGKLWLAEVDEKHEIIICYKYHLTEGCTRAILEQEDTVSFYSNGTTGLPDFSVSKDCMLFLYDIEKQGEQKSADKAKVEHLIPQKGMYYTCIKDYYSLNNTHLYVKGKVYKSFFNGYIDDESHFGLSWTNSCTEKYFEPTKDEDWIVCEHDNVIGKPMQYKEFKKKINQKFIENLKAKGITPNLKLWTIQDAKDGDVLVSNQITILFKKFEENSDCNFVIAYAGIDVSGKLQITDGHWLISNNSHPATKEQRDTLFAKMKEAGYEWDAEKKELKKIEQKPVDKYKEWYDFIRWFVKQRTADYTLIPSDDDIHKWGDNILNHAKKFFDKQKPAWSEEDELHIRELESLVKQAWAVAELKNDKDTIHKMSDLSFFLKTLKPQPKQEWSEEDEEIINKISIAIAAIYSCSTAAKVEKWLKSLKERYTWKPSKEQIETLDDFIYAKYPNTEKHGAAVKSLYQDLKKLMEE